MNPPRCIECDTEEVFTGYGETNIPHGSHIIFAWYLCPNCQRGLSVVPFLFGYFQHDCPQGFICLDLRGEIPVQIPCFSFKELTWTGSEWARNLKELMK